MNALNFNNAVFYVMIGTGNTYRVACWADEILSLYGVKAKVVMIDDAFACVICFLQYLFKIYTINNTLPGREKKNILCVASKQAQRKYA